MKSTLKLACAALVAAGLLAIGGCSAAPSQAIPKSEPTFTPVFKTDAEAMAAANKDYVGYLSVTQAIGASHDFDRKSLAKWVTISYLADLHKDFQALVDAGHYNSGALKVTFFASQDLDEAHSGKVTLTAYMCEDITGTRILDQTGEDITPANRRPVLPLLLRFKNSETSPRTLLLDRSDLWTGHDFC